MVTVIVKKENYPEWLSLKMIRTFKHNGIISFLYKKYWKLKGYEVEELEESDVKDFYE